MKQTWPWIVASWILAVNVAPSPAVKPVADDEILIQGQLVRHDVPDKRRRHPCKIHTLQLSKGKVYIIDMQSKEFDTYLRIEDPQGNNLAEDDDGGGGLNSRLHFQPPVDALYQISATSYSGAVGMYILKIQVAGPGKNPRPIEKEAPKK